MPSFDKNYDPSFDLRAAEMSQTATVHQEALDAADGATTNVAVPEGEPADDGGSTLEHVGDNLLAAAEDGLLAVAAPALAPVVAAAAAGEALLDAGKEAYNVASDVTDTIGGLFSSGDAHPGESTFATDPDAPPESPEEYAAKMAQAEEAMDKAGADFDKSVRLWDGRHDAVEELDLRQHGDGIGDVRLQDTHAIDTDVTTGIARPIEIEPDIVGSGAGALGAPDNVMEPVDELRDHVGIGAAGANAVVARDGGMEPVAALSADVAIGADSVINVDRLMSPDHALADVPLGSDVQLNPQPIPPGLGADLQLSAQSEESNGMGADKTAADYAPDNHPGAGADKTAADYAPDNHPGAGADKTAPAPDTADHQSVGVHDSSIIIVGGDEGTLDVGEPPTAGNAPAPIALGDDVQLNPQPIPPGLDTHPPSPCIGADLGEPAAADVAVDEAPSVDDASIIIVGGDESPMLSDDIDTSFGGANDVAFADSPMDDVASTLATDGDGPAFHTDVIDDAPIDVGITEDEFNS
jgi:hypothetical protein